MNLFVRGGMSLAALLFAAFLIFYARPLLAETTPSQQAPSAQQEQQETKAPAQAAQGKQEAEAKTTAQAETAELSETGNDAAATKLAVKDADAAAATTIKVASPAAEPGRAPQPYIAFSYSLCCKGSSGLGVRRGTIAADPRVLPELGDYLSIAVNGDDVPAVARLSNRAAPDLDERLCDGNVGV